MSKNFKFASLVLSLIFCFSAVAFGQRTTGDIEGTVRDPQGAVVPGVSINITGVNVGFNRTVQSDDQGIYRVQQIPAGIYKITAAAVKGFAETTLDNVAVNIEQISTSDINLGVTAAVNTVEVSTDPLGVNVDTTDSKIQTNITTQLIEQLPKGTSFESLLKVSPATRNEPLGGGFQVDGASGSENSFVVDGQTLENFRTGTLNQNNNIPTSLVQEIQIKTSGFEAEHGGASGGVITVQTKGGTDQWRGEFGQQFEVSRLQPGDRFAPQSFIDPTVSLTQYAYGIRGPQDSFTNTYPTLSLGGPIIKKRVWFYGNYSPQIFQTTRTSSFYDFPDTSSFTSPGSTNVAGAGVASGVNLTNSEGIAPVTYKNKVTNEYAFGRIDASIFNNLRYSGTYLWNPTITNGILPFDAINLGTAPGESPYNGQNYSSLDYSALQGGRTSSNNFTSQLVYTPFSKLVLSLRYGRAFLNEKNGNYAAAAQTQYVCVGFASAYNGQQGCALGFDSLFGANNSVTLRDISLRNEVNADATYSLNNFGGRHEFKGGYQYGTTKNDVSSGYATTGRVAFRYGRNFSSYGVSGLDQLCNLATDCAGVGRLVRFGTQGIASNKYQGIFIQDKWQPISRLTLNLGVRAEKEDLPAFNVTGGRGGQPISFNFGKKIAPRLGVAYDLFGNGKTRIFASYGLFYDRLKFALPRGSFGGDFYRLDYFRISRANQLYSFYTPARIVGGFTDPIGGGTPSSAGGLSVFQQDQRIPSNITEAQAAALGLPFAGVDNDLKPFRQSEITVGAERELSRIFVLTVRYTRKNVDTAIEDHGILGANGSENYIISNPGEGRAAELDRQAGYIKDLKPQRLYNGLEISLSKRLSNNYFFNANYTLSRLYGNYSGLASSDEPTINSATDVGGRTDPGVSRYFDYIVNGYTFNGTPDNGNLATDRRHAFKAYGGYNFDWFGSKTNTTELSFFQSVLQGTPQTTFITVNQSAIVFTKRGDLGRSPTFKQTDLALTHRYRFGKDNRFTAAFDINVLNAFNNNSVLLFNTNRYAVQNTVPFDVIDPNYATTNNAAGPLNRILAGQFTPAQADAYLSSYTGGGDVLGNPKNVLYGKPAVYQAPRNVRFGFRLLF